MSAAPPWDDMKICFGINSNPGRLWKAFEEQRLPLPNGWELNETDMAGASGYVAIFRVSVFPTAADAYSVKRQLRRFCS